MRSPAAARISSRRTTTSPAATREWMGQLYGFLGLTIGFIQHDQYPPDAPRAVRLRHHLRHELGVRLRLPARQRHGHVARSSRCSAATTSPSSTKSTRSSSTRRARRSSSAARRPSRRISSTSSSRSSISSCKQADDALQPARLRGGGAFGRRARPRSSGRLMVKVKLGQPRNKGLLRAMEDPEKRRAIDKTELVFSRRHAEGGALRAQGGAVLRRSTSAPTRPTSASRAARFMNPGRSGRLRAAGSDHAVRRDRPDTPGLDATREKLEEKQKRQAYMRSPERAHPQHLPAPARLLPLREGRAVRRRGRQGRHRR